MELSGANTYTGGTKVIGGALNLSFLPSTAPTANILESSGTLTLEGTTLNLYGKATAGTKNSQTLSGVTLGNGNSTLNIINGINSAVTLFDMGAITRNKGATVNFLQPTVNTTISSTNGYKTSTGNDSSGILGGWATISGTAWVTNSGINVVAYTGYSDLSGANPTILDGAATNLRINNGSTGNIGLASGTTTINTLLVSDTTARTITIGTGTTLRLGATGGILNTATTLVIGASGNAGVLTAGGADNTAGELIFTNNKDVTVNSVVANNGTGVVVLTKAGSGILTLTDANSYTGGTFVNGGVLAFAGNNIVTATTTNNSKSVTVASAVGLTVGQSITGANIPAGSKIIAITSNTVTISQLATAAGSINMTYYTGGTTDRLNTSGDIIVSGGTFELGNAAASQTTSGNVVFRGGVVSSGTITKSGADYDARAGIVSTNLSGSVGLVKTTGGRIYLSGNNSYTGDTVIEEGSIVGGVDNSGSYLTIKGNLIVGSASGGLPASYSTVTNAAGTLNNAKNLTIYSNGDVNMGNGANHLGSGLYQVFGGVFNVGAQCYVDGGPSTISMTGGTLSGYLGYGSGSVLVKSLASSSTVSVSANTALSASFDVADGAAAVDLNFSGTSSGASKNLTKIGPGLMAATGNSSYAGVTTINGGILRVATINNGGTNGNIGAATNVAANLVFNGGVLQYTGTAASTNRLFTTGTTAGSGLDASGSGTITFANTGTIALSGAAARTFTLTGTNTGDNTLTSVLTDSGSYKTSLTKAGVGKWVLAGANTYTGSTLVSGGTLAAGNGAAFGTGVITVSGGVLDLTATNVANVINITGTNASVRLQASAAALNSKFAANSNFRGWQRNSGLTNNTLAQFLGGTATSGAATVTSSWAVSTNTSRIVSDVIDIKGLNGTTFALQLNYVDTGKGAPWENANVFLGWLNSSTQWVNAVDGNSGGTSAQHLGAYDAGTYGLGDWGVDSTNHVVWAVVNHNSEFAVVVPEPAALALFALGGLALLRRRRCETV